MKINYSNISPELLKLAQSSVKDGKITQTEYDNLVKTAIKNDRQLNKDEQMFLASLDNKSVVSQILDSKFNPKGLSFEVDKQDSKNPSLRITRQTNGSTVIDPIKVRTISSQQTLEKNLIIGRSAAEYAKTHVISSNKAGSAEEFLTSTVAFFPNIIARSDAMIAAPQKSLDSPPKEVKNPGDDYMEAHKVARIAERNAVGNCGENAALTAIYLANKGVSPVETFVKPRHQFTVIGRDPSSNPNDPSTWGPTAVVVDAWSRKVYPASEISKEMFGGSTPDVSKYLDIAK